MPPRQLEWCSAQPQGEGLAAHPVCAASRAPWRHENGRQTVRRATGPKALLESRSRGGGAPRSATDGAADTSTIPGSRPGAAAPNPLGSVSTAAVLPHLRSDAALMALQSSPSPSSTPPRTDVARPRSQEQSRAQGSHNSSPPSKRPRAGAPHACPACEGRHRAHTCNRVTVAHRANGKSDASRLCAAAKKKGGSVEEPKRRGVLDAGLCGDAGSEQAGGGTRDTENVVGQLM